MNFSTILPQSFGTFIPGIKYKNRPAAYAVILNSEGKIVFATSGKYAPAKMDEIEESIE